jgi:hypothetical protein
VITSTECGTTKSADLGTNSPSERRAECLVLHLAIVLSLCKRRRIPACERHEAMCQGVSAFSNHSTESGKDSLWHVSTSTRLD